MNGPQHYHEAERLLQEVDSDPRDSVNSRRLEIAKIHALLAVAAASVDLDLAVHWREAML